MKTVEIRALETDELHARVAELKEEIFNLRFQHATGQLDNHRRMRQCKQEIARIKTILRERDYAAAQAQTAAEPNTPAATQTTTNEVESNS